MGMYISSYYMFIIISYKFHISFNIHNFKDLGNCFDKGFECLVVKI